METGIFTKIIENQNKINEITLKLTKGGHLSDEQKELIDELDSLREEVLNELKKLEESDKEEEYE